MKKVKILFLCTGNSCRSQMAEGWTRALKSEEIEAYSAGIETHGLNPSAALVMAEVGVDITCQQSQLFSDFSDKTFDWVITVCGHAHESCPILPAGTKVVHVGFEDPPKLAKALADQGATVEEQLEPYRQVRDEIHNFVLTLPQYLETSIDSGPIIDVLDCSQCSGCD